jgi:hypothetical protein
MVKAVLAELQSGAGVTREGLEDRFADFIAATSLPPPETNACSISTAPGSSATASGEPSA